MERPRHDSDFTKAFRRLIETAGTSGYALSQFSDLSETYIHRLAKGERYRPTRNVVIRISLALVRASSTISIEDLNELLLLAGHAPLFGRGEEPFH